MRNNVYFDFPLKYNAKELKIANPNFLPCVHACVATSRFASLCNVQTEKECLAYRRKNLCVLFFLCVLVVLSIL